MTQLVIRQSRHTTIAYTYLLSHSRGTPLSHLHCPVGQLRSRVVGPEYVGHRWWVQGGGKVGRGGGGGDYYSTLQAVSLSASLFPHLFLSSSSWLPLACSPHSTPAHPAFGLDFESILAKKVAAEWARCPYGPHGLSMHDRPRRSWCRWSSRRTYPSTWRWSAWAACAAAVSAFAVGLLAFPSLGRLLSAPSARPAHQQAPTHQRRVRNKRTMTGAFG